MRSPGNEAAAWFAKGDKDWQVAELAFNSNGAFLADMVCYHAQQSAEKYLKGFLVSQSVPFRFIHDLDYLLNLCCGQDTAFEGLHTAAAGLQVYASTTRYPGEEFAEASLEDARMALSHAQQIRDLVRAKLQA